MMEPLLVILNVSRYNIVHRPEKAMLLIMVKAVLCFQNYFVIHSLEGIDSSYI